jgi:MoaA/NifB/PqqE/SkfB family radical SAM enzyme
MVSANLYIQKSLYKRGEEILGQDQDILIPTGAKGKPFRTMRSTNYDVNNTCNLTCEGCYYFVSGQKTQNRRPSGADYAAFFQGEKDRGVNYPIFSGGEPSLNPNALRAAADLWPTGIIYTNGIKKIPGDVPFRIAVSVWGAQSRNDAVRGSASYRNAFETAKGDPRAMIYMTINRDNIDDIREVVADSAAAGVDISFNDFSMTTEYIRLLESSGGERSNYFRFSTVSDNLSLRPSDRLRAADIIDEMIDRYPQRVVFSKRLNDWIHRSPAIHTIDPQTGIATDCAMLKADWHRSYDFDLKPLKGKPCCAPEFDCTDCRVGPVATFTLLNKLTMAMRRSQQARTELLELRDLMMRYYFWDWSPPDSGRQPSPGDVAPEAFAAVAV